MKINIKNFIAMGALVLALPVIAHADDGRITVARAFYELARNNNTQKIETLLDKGYSIESVDEQGYNPVCIAVAGQDKSAYRTLTSYGAAKKPSCLQKIPESAYKRFFGMAPTKGTTTAITNTSDTPYLIGATVLGAGALAAAYALRGKTDSGSGGGGKKTCRHGTYDKETQKCNCDSGYGNYGDDTTCYATVSNCKIQTKSVCSECNSGYSLKNNVCYAPIPNCKVQDGDTCKECDANYSLKNNVCYAPIPNCKVQDGDTCKQCNSGYDIHGGDGTQCYIDIPNCKTQKEAKCQQCVPGYGNHGDTGHCYKDIDHCMIQVQTACNQCAQGYDTYGNPDKDYCYSENPCAAWEHTVPVRDGGTVTCVCDENKGYFGEPGNCKKEDEGEAHEGDGHTEEWNNLNAQYCNSHGKYDITTGWCTCYTGYAGPTNGCSGCAEGYTNLGKEGGVCYKKLSCGIHKHQVDSVCVCDDGYYSYEGSCYESLQCELHYIQTDPTTCSCKEHFNEDCSDCKEGYTYVEETDECIRESYLCDEKWTGSDCDICPSQFKITYEGGVRHCWECAANRLSREEGNDDECSLCAAGYDKDDMFDACIVTECSAGTPGYIKDETTGKCVCDEANGYARSLLGTCVKKGEDIVGLKNGNINNSKIKITLDGASGEFSDIYGMRPVMEDEEGNKTYYEEVYNAYADAKNGDKKATIDITNKNAGGNVVYGIYSPNTIYNAAVYNQGAIGSAYAEASINIKDENTISNLFGMANMNQSSIFNAFVRNTADASGVAPSNNIATATIKITKDEDSLSVKEENGTGTITGIKGVGNILNSYASTVGGTAANAYTNGNIELLHNGIGEVIGIYGIGPGQKISNAFSYLDSAISDAVAIGKISVSGNSNVYGVLSSGTVVNSETQFSKNFPVVKNFRAEGTISATARTDEGTAYGIYIYNSGADVRADVYNAYGYKSIGDIDIRNMSGGSAYGIWNAVKTYTDTESGEPVILYTNTYNAFRSSAKYGGDNSTTTGNISVNISGISNGLQTATGMYASGDVFNSYARSLSDEGLKTIGNIIIRDASRTPGMTVRGIESGGGTIANAYATGSNLNTATSVIGNINIGITGSKQGSAGEASGIYSNEPSSQVAKIYNAALVQDTSNAEGNITISATGSTSFGHIYGIYASRNEGNGGSSGNGQEKVVYNAYYENDSSSAGSVTGTINVSTTNRSMSGTGEYYGIYVNGGEAYNAYSTVPGANAIGRITVNVAGGTNNGRAVGMFGNNSKLHNTGNSIISVTSSRQNNDAYGMQAKGEGSYIENDAIINVTSKEAKAYGMYVENGQAVNGASGDITVSGKKGSYGIYAKDDGTTTIERKVINQGRINLISGENNIGIYADGANLRVYNAAGARIYINGAETSSTCEGEECTNTAIQLVNGAQLINNGDILSDSDLILTSVGGDVILDKDGSFKAANSITGNLNIASSAVTDNFDDITSLKRAVSAADVSKLNLKSNSFLYNSTLKSNADGSYDVVLERKGFDAITHDKDDAQYLEKNYSNGRNMEVFNTLKAASTAAEGKKTWAEMSGNAVLPNITEEELKVQRSLDRTMMGELFEEKSDEDVRKMVGGDVMHIGRDTHGTLTGYDLDSQSMYALYDQKQNNNYRLGLGLSFTHTDTDYNNDSRRKNFMVQGYAPLTYTNSRGLTAVSMARLGYSNGDYTRRGHNKVSYKADTEAITYGLLNEARYTYDLSYLKLTPFVGLNATGWYQDSSNEGKDDLALHIASSHVFSLESALGLYLNKEIEFNQDQKLDMALGMGYYHEFADPYKGAKARYTGTLGHYHLKNKLHSRDRGMLSAKVNYDYKNLSVYGEIIQYLEEENPIELEGGLQYKF